MTTANDVIERAFSLAKVRAAETTITAAEANDALHMLNNLIAGWNVTGQAPDLETVDSVDDDLNERSYERGALEAILAVMICAEYGKPMSAELGETVKQMQAMMISANMNGQNVSFPSTLPRGSGNDDDQTFFPEKGNINF